MCKWIERIVAIIGALFILWGVVSFVEINTKNLTESPTYWEYNLIIMLMGDAGE